MNFCTALQLVFEVRGDGGGAAVTVNDVIILINSIRKLEGDLFVESENDREPGIAFSSIGLVESCLERCLGAKGKRWHTGSGDRLFTYVTLHCDIPDSLNTFSMRRKISYHVASVTRLTTMVDESFIADFTQEHGYSRFYTVEDGGSHIVFSHNGGASVVVNGHRGNANIEKGWKGTIRYTRALIEPIVYQMTYLQSLSDACWYVNICC